MARSYLCFSYLLFWIILDCKSCYLFNAYGLMSLKISKTSDGNASLYNSVLPWAKYVITDRKKEFWWFSAVNCNTVSFAL